MNPDPLIVQQAIAWMVLLQTGNATEQQLADCQRWRDADPLHALAWERLGKLGQPLHGIPPVLAYQALGNERVTRQRVQGLMQRRQALKLLVLIGGTAGMLGVGYRLPWKPMLAAYTTGVGEHRRVMLADGSEVMLNTSSALDDDFSPDMRLLHFYQGEMQVTTAHEADRPYRPLVVATSHGRLRALGTRFLVRQQPGGIRLAVVEGTVEVNIEGGRQLVHAGQQVHFSREQIQPVQALDLDTLGWLDGVLIAKRMRLADFLGELDRYRRGHISCDPALADMPISGVFPLAQPERILDAVSNTLSVHVVRYWHYWVRIVPASQHAA